MIAELEAPPRGPPGAGARSPAGLPPGGRSPRFQQSLDIIAGRRHIYLQEPTGYYFPELPQIQFYDPARVRLGARARGRDRRHPGGAGRGALAARMDELPALYPAPRRIGRATHPLLDKQDWSALFFCENGRRSEDDDRALPANLGGGAGGAAALGRAGPRRRSCSRCSGAAPGFPPHTGMLNTRLICHLPLIVPPGCGFRVGNETRRVGGGQAAHLRRYDRARSLERERRGPGGADLRHLAARAERDRAAGGRRLVLHSRRSCAARPIPSRRGGIICQFSGREKDGAFARPRLRSPALQSSSRSPIPHCGNGAADGLLERAHDSQHRGMER